MQSFALICIILVLIILPFVLFGAQIDQAALNWSASVGPSGLGVVVISLLAFDILLPVPSSVVSLIAGKTMGFFQAALAIWIGMTLGCYIGVLVARGVLSPVAEFLGIKLPEAGGSPHFQRWGWVSLILLRPVPILAEASVLYAAVRVYPTGRLMLATSIANFPIAFLYAYAGDQLLNDVPLWIMVSVLALFSAPALIRQFFRRGKWSKI